MSDSNEEVKKMDDAVIQVLQDPTKKRKAEDEIEIDLNQSVPLSKKQKRLLRRGKITIEELNAKYNIDSKSIEEYKKETAEKPNGDEETTKKENSTEENSNDNGKATSKANKERKFGVWVGNMAFDTVKEDIIRFIVAKTKENDEDSIISEKDIIRINLPLTKSDNKKLRNKGFAYIDFKNEKHMEAAIALSESALNGRNLLIKNASSYEGRPDKNDLVAASKNPPSRILFVGNLSFDTTEDLLRKHFQHCGEIMRIRMATFEDTGKCKGFAFVDFKDETGATNALKDKNCTKIASRPIRMEFGEDRSKRQVRRRPEQETREPRKPSFDIKSTQTQTQPQSAPPIRERRAAPSYSNRQPSYKDSNNRLKSSVALASAQRGSAAIVPSKGKKTTF
ncbi:unnamed protein product [Kluyveromyces dobzhanskii CBS 2104]|uniref:WGS project CCBQ000000000 data, contig 00104 n=1 Tax=Kluyveromyces dobzhanskii CBS 2104 TaxID=1427455 RepID=A0A0A8L625_9SACH|nr:unnamed protein product [Kluyveromyces dobzhanskii CBS 2104]